MSTEFNNPYETCDCGPHCGCVPMHNYENAYWRLLRRPQIESLRDSPLQFNVVEWGPGPQTDIAIDAGGTVVSVESQKRWLHEPREDLLQLLVNVHQDRYVELAPLIVRRLYGQLDLAFVDGRRRADCVVDLAENHGEQLLAVFLHDAQRERYHDALRAFEYVNFIAPGCAVASRREFIMDLRSE